MKHTIRIAALCAAVFICSGSAWGASTIWECEVTGWANFATGVMFDGEGVASFDQRRHQGRHHGHPGLPRAGLFQNRNMHASPDIRFTNQFAYDFWNRSPFF